MTEQKRKTWTGFNDVIALFIIDCMLNVANFYFNLNYLSSKPGFQGRYFDKKNKDRALTEWENSGTLNDKICK